MLRHKQPDRSSHALLNDPTAFPESNNHSRLLFLRDRYCGRDDRGDRGKCCFGTVRHLFVHFLLRIFLGALYRGLPDLHSSFKVAVILSRDLMDGSHNHCLLWVGHS